MRRRHRPRSVAIVAAALPLSVRRRHFPRRASILGVVVECAVVAIAIAMKVVVAERCFYPVVVLVVVLVLVVVVVVFDNDRTRLLRRGRCHDIAAVKLFAAAATSSAASAADGHSDVEIEGIEGESTKGAGEKGKVKMHSC